MRISNSGNECARPDQDEQRDRAHQPRDQEEDEGRRDLPGRQPALMLVTARLKYIAEHEWGKRKYLHMSMLEKLDELKEKAEGQKRTEPRTAKSICERNFR